MKELIEEARDSGADKVKFKTEFEKEKRRLAELKQKEPGVGLFIPGRYLFSIKLRIIILGVGTDSANFDLSS